MEFPDGSKFTGTWQLGAVVSGKVIFPDGLEMEGNPNEWDYCTGADRRFFSEKMSQLQPSPNESLQN